MSVTGVPFPTETENFSSLSFTCPVGLTAKFTIEGCLRNKRSEREADHSTLSKAETLNVHSFAYVM
jgi:hypothetical protein